MKNQKLPKTFIHAYNAQSDVTDREKFREFVMIEYGQRLSAFHMPCHLVTANTCKPLGLIMRQTCKFNEVRNKDD